LASLDARITPLKYESEPSTKGCPGWTEVTLLPEKASKLGGDATPLPHVNRSVPLPLETKPEGPIGLSRIPDALALNDIGVLALSSDSKPYSNGVVWATASKILAPRNAHAIVQSTLKLYALRERPRSGSFAKHPGRML
jgi:hypothetical protein